MKTENTTTTKILKQEGLTVHDIIIITRSVELFVEQSDDAIKTINNKDFKKRATEIRNEAKKTLKKLQKLEKAARAMAEENK